MSISDWADGVGRLCKLQICFFFCSKLPARQCKGIMDRELAPVGIAGGKCWRAGDSADKSDRSDGMGSYTRRNHALAPVGRLVTAKWNAVFCTKINPCKTLCLQGANNDALNCRHCALEAFCGIGDVLF